MLALIELIIEIFCAQVVELKLAGAYVYFSVRPCVLFCVIQVYSGSYISWLVDPSVEETPPTDVSVKFSHCILYSVLCI